MAVAERIGTFPHDSPEWHAARAQGIGASEIAAVLGLSPYESHFSLWHRKAGIVGPQPVNDDMRLGHYFEPAIARIFADEHPELRVRRTGTWCSRMRPWQLSNPDRLLHGWYEDTWLSRIPLEIKWSPNGEGWSREPEGIPVGYRCQVQWQLDVMGAPFAFLAAIVGGEYREYRIAYDPTDVEVLRKAGQEFMDSLERGEAPDIDATGHTHQVLRELHPDIDGEAVEIPRSLANDYRYALLDEHEAKALARVMKSRMLNAMGTARYAACDGETIARRQPGRGGAISLHEVHPPKEPKTIKEATQA